jgi:mRNA interferase HigB
MRVTGKDKLADFMKRHPQARGPLKAWLAEAESARWMQWADIKNRYPSADLISGASGKSPGHRVVFNIKGNNYRLVVQVYFNQGNAIIERIGTHAEYSKWKL